MALVERGEPIEGLLDLRADVLARAGDRRDAERGVERIGQRAGIGEPLERRAGEAALQDAHHRPRQRRLGGRAGHDRRGDLLGSVALEGALAGDELVGEHAEREHVGRGGGGLVGELLRGEVRDALREARRLERPLRQGRREQAEIGDLDVALGGDDHVGRREAEVGEAAAMGVADGARGLRDQRERTAGGQADAGQPSLGDQPQRIEAEDVLDGGERRALGDAELAHPRDPRVLEAAVGARGRGQHRRHRRGRGQLGVEPLDGKLALEASHAKHLRARYRAARTDPDRLQQLIATDALRRTGGVRHRR